MGKPLIYFQLDELTQCEPGWFSYEEDGLGPVRKTVDEVVGCIGFLLKRDCQVGDAYAKRIDSLFAYRDRSNRKCVLDATLPEGLRWRTFRLWGSDLCQDFGHGRSRNHAAIGSSSSVGLVRSKNASMSRAGIL